MRPGILAIVPSAMALCAFIDITEMHKRFLAFFAQNKLGSFERGMRFLCAIPPDDLSKNSDVFFAVWGVAIAVAIFIVEISGSFHCGISLKRITRWQWGDDIIYGGLEYLLLGPLIYVSNSWFWKLTSFGCVCAAFVGMGYMLCFFQHYMHIDNIQELLVDKSTEMLYQWKKKAQIVTHSEIDKLPVADMLMHIAYDQADEVRIMLDTLVRVMVQGRDSIRGTSLENTLLVTWVKHIVRYSGIADEDERERTLNLIIQLWGQVSKNCTQRECQSYSVQLLIPFMDIGSEEAVKMLVRVWKRLNLYSQTSVIYLLLYTEFRYWFIDGKIHKWIDTDDPSMRRELERIRKGRFTWDEEAARQYWLDWSQYSCQRGDIGLLQFENFRRSAEALKGNSGDHVQLSVLSCI